MKKIIWIFILAVAAFVGFTIYTEANRERTPFYAAKELPKLIKEKGALSIPIYKILDMYNENIDLKDFEKAFKKVMKKEEINFGKYYDFQKIIDKLPTKKKYEFHFLPSDIKLANKLLDQNIPIIVHLPDTYVPLYSKPFLLTKEKNNIVRFDPIKYLADKKSEDYEKTLNEKEIEEIINNRITLILISKDQKILPKIKETDILVNKVINEDFTGFNEKNIKKQNINNTVKEKILLELNEDNPQKIKELFSVYRFKYLDKKLTTDYDFIKYFVEHNITDKEYFYFLADKIYDNSFPASTLGFKKLQNLQFYTAAGCSISNNKEKLKEYERKFFGIYNQRINRLKLEKKFDFYNDLKDIGLTVDTFKVYKTFQDIPDILN